MELAATSPRQSAIASVHRTMNERRKADGPRATPDSITCECECHRAECGDNFEITVADYEAVRAWGSRFVVAHGHQADDEVVIFNGGSFSVIEKVGDQRRLALALDPR